MAYPKLLSEKRLLKMYADAKISDQKKEFLHTFFLAAARLYGSVELRELWDIYKILSQKTTVIKLTRHDLTAFAGIVRREDVPYYVFEIDEIYSEEVRKDISRFLVMKDIVQEGYGKFHTLWDLHEQQFGKEPFIPDNFIDYAEETMTDNQKKLLDFLGNLKVTAKEVTDKTGNTYKCEHIGECLKDFEFLTSDDRFQISYLSGEFKEGPKKNEKKLEAFLNSCRGSIASRLYNDYMWRMKTGYIQMQRSMQMLCENLEETGVQLSEKELNNLIKLLTMTQNTTNLWCNMGWKPVELTKKMYDRGPVQTVISFGPGIQQAISEGKMDREELVRIFKEKGFEVM